ncbi:unnamed protein product [Adineta ricciae]|uniref:Uncharacterized protein n=1 Tax=Adineta ricciae TaxID=249248 RepID=A0A814EE65_ADIRI|nr:unnamed protein product [Adineta ricciae]CAF1410189.1 unnamed protein product [Adineta ricciae]
MSINSTQITSSYIPSRYAASIFATIVYISLIAWFIQTLHFKYRPYILSLFIFLSHLITFVELILRATVNIDTLNTKIYRQITSALCSLSPRLLLLANYRCLVDLRGKKPSEILDRLMDVVIPLNVLNMDSLLCLADDFSFAQKHQKLSIYFRQASNGFSFSLALLFYIFWYLAVSRVRRLYVLPLVTVSSICVSIETGYTFLISIPHVFSFLTQNEFYYYVCHVIPMFVALVTWSIFHPWRFLPPSEANVPRDASGNELLAPPPPSFY